MKVCCKTFISFATCVKDATWYVVTFILVIHQVASPWFNLFGSFRREDSVTLSNSTDQ